MSKTPGDHPSVSIRTPATPGHRHRHQALEQTFRVGYQKVTLDVDLAERTLYGETELTILPLESSLREIKLDCRNIQIRSVVVNQRRARFTYGDFSQNEEYMNDDTNPVLADYSYDKYYDTNSTNMGIEQHHMYRGQYFPLYSDQLDDDSVASPPVNTNELTIRIPDSIKLRLQSTADATKTYSPATAAAITTGGPPTNASMNGITPGNATTAALTNPERVYTPLNVKINYIVRNSKNGLHFQGGNNTSIPRTGWCCYTYNNDLNCSASCWVPCVDSFLEKPAWDINLVVPKTVADIGQSKLVRPEAPEENENAKENENADDDEEEEADADDEGEDSTPIVVAVPDLISFKEMPHQIDMDRKVVNFQFYNPVSPHHLGFAIGAFETSPMMVVKPGSDRLAPSTAFSSSTDTNTDATVDMQTNDVPTLFYYPSGLKNQVLNSTIFLYKAMEFYSKEFSSFPFQSYSVVFLKDLPCDVCTFAGMTLVSDRLLYGPEMIEPIHDTTEKLAAALAEQYSGVNVLPKTFNDIWCTVGLAHYMALQLMKKLFGANFLKHLIKKRSDLLCRLDIGQRSLSQQCARFPVNWDTDLNLIKLKAPLILHILNQRMVKTDKSFGLSRVIPKLFLQAMSNDLSSGNCLSSAHFQHVCEKVAHHKLDQFFNNWVRNSGVPVFRITQRFNKKRMFIEMTVRQMQRTTPHPENDEEAFMVDDDQVVARSRRRNFIDTVSYDEEPPQPQNLFTGPLTIRIHEADGTPYEHILFVRDTFTKLDIQYNTKYRRAKKRREGKWEDDEVDTKKVKDDEPKEITFGDVLQTASEAHKWGLREDEIPDLPMDPHQSAFEWLRFDADNEWICEKHINVTDDMQESQLRQDRDVEAQVDAVMHFSQQTRPTLHSANILLRTVVDARYFYGVRIDAAKALSRISKEENDHIGMRYLLKAFKHLYCYGGDLKPGYNEFDPKEYLPLPNDFSKFPDLFLEEAILKSLAKIKNKDGDTPIELKQILLSIYKYNDNMDNEFNDSPYVALQLNGLSNLIMNADRPIADHNVTVLDEIIPAEDPRDQFAQEAIMEMNRAVKMDEWSPSFHDCITRTILEQKVKLALKKLIRVDFDDLLKYTEPIYPANIRITAFEGLLLLGGLKNAAILELFFSTIKVEQSNYMRYHMIHALVDAMGVAAVDGTVSSLDDDEFLVKVNGKVSKGFIEEDTGSTMKARRDQMARKTNAGAVALLRRDYSIGHGLRKELWNAIHSCLLPIGAKREVLDVCAILYPAKDSFVVKTSLPTEKKIMAKVEDVETEEGQQKFVVGFKREGRLIIQIPSIKLKAARKPVIRLHRTASKVGAKPPVEPVVPVKREPELFIPPAPKRVKVDNSGDNFTVKLSFTPGTVLPGAPKRVHSEIVKTSSILPLRYVKIRLLEKEIWLSDDENFGFKKAKPVLPICQQQPATGQPAVGQSAPSQPASAPPAIPLPSPSVVTPAEPAASAPPVMHLKLRVSPPPEVELESVKSADPVETVNPVDPVEPAEPAEPTQTVEQAKPVEPAKHVDIESIDPLAPAPAIPEPVNDLPTEQPKPKLKLKLGLRAKASEEQNPEEPKPEAAPKISIKFRLPTSSDNSKDDV